VVLIPGPGTKILHAAQHSQKVKNLIIIIIKDLTTIAKEHSAF